MSDEDTTPTGDDGDLNLYTRIVARTALLAASIALLFPMLLDRLTHGEWPRLVATMGPWRWAAWGACFAAMTLMRFAGGPRRG